MVPWVWAPAEATEAVADAPLAWSSVFLGDAGRRTMTSTMKGTTMKYLAGTTGRSMGGDENQDLTSAACTYSHAQGEGPYTYQYPSMRNEVSDIATVLARKGSQINSNMRNRM